MLHVFDDVIQRVLAFVEDDMVEATVDAMERIDLDDDAGMRRRVDRMFLDLCVILEAETFHVALKFSRQGATERDESDAHARLLPEVASVGFRFAGSTTGT